MEKSSSEGRTVAGVGFCKTAQAVAMTGLESDDVSSIHSGRGSMPGFRASWGGGCCAADVSTKLHIDYVASFAFALLHTRPSSHYPELVRTYVIGDVSISGTQARTASRSTGVRQPKQIHGEVTHRQRQHEQPSTCMALADGS